MSDAISGPPAPARKLLAHQVAGHPGSVLTTGDGECIIKPSLPLEIEFYSSTAPKHFPELVEKGYIPRFYGVHTNDLEPSKGPKNELAIKLENLTHGYTKPNVIDIKLGTQLFDPFDERLTPEKQARMESESRRTTSGSTGLRMTGFTVYNAQTDSYVSTPKEYGKSIPAEELVHAFRRFFPCAAEDPSIHTSSPLTPPPPNGVPASVLTSIIQAILAHVQELQQLVQGYEWRLYGSSLLVVYEGSPETLEQQEPRVTVKWIDFAHTRYSEGQGLDEGVLRGLASVERLLMGRLEELKAL